MSKQLNINPEMDKLAREHGLGHWSCVSPKSNRFWVRSDGVTLCYDFGSNLFELITRFDCNNSIGEDWQKPKQPTLVQKPFKYPCDGAMYFEADNRKQVFIIDEHENYLVGHLTSDRDFILHYDKQGKRIKTGYDSFSDLIMFVWE